MSGTVAAAVRTRKMNKATARAIGGSHSQAPAHDTARNRPTAVAMAASGGHSRSQKVIQRALFRARASMAPAASGWGASGEWLASVNRFSAGPALYLHTQSNARKQISDGPGEVIFRPVHGTWRPAAGQIRGPLSEISARSITSNRAAVECNDLVDLEAGPHHGEDGRRLPSPPPPAAAYCRFRPARRHRPPPS